MFWCGHLGNIWFLEPNFMKSEKSVFNVESYIFFMHSELATYVVPRLPPSLVIFQNYPFCFFFLPYPPSASPSLPSETNRHFAGVITGLHSHLPPIGNLPLFPFPFPFSLSWWCQKRMKERERGQGKKEKERLPTRERCEWWLVMTPTKC